MGHYVKISLKFLLYCGVFVLEDCSPSNFEAGKHLYSSKMDTSNFNFQFIKEGSILSPPLLRLRGGVQGW